MRVDLFDFELPEENIALRPAEPRDSDGGIRREATDPEAIAPGHLLRGRLRHVLDPEAVVGDEMAEADHEGHGPALYQRQRPGGIE